MKNKTHAITQIILILFGISIMISLIIDYRHRTKMYNEILQTFPLDQQAVQGTLRYADGSTIAWQSDIGNMHPILWCTDDSAYATQYDISINALYLVKNGFKLTEGQYYKECNDFEIVLIQKLIGVYQLCVQRYEDRVCLKYISTREELEAFIESMTQTDD